MISSLKDITTALKGRELLASIGEDVRLVEEELTLQCQSDVEMVQQICRHTLEAGGKRLRPAFLILTAKATGLPFESIRATRLGACMEMIHMATLIHDDVIDNSPTRRGKPTASAVYGATGSILSGDALLAKAMVLLAADGDLEIIRNVAQAVVQMAEGEVREVETRNQFDLSLEDHLHILHLKTASFVQSCCFVGASLTHASPEVIHALETYGRHIGLAFQIIDDLLDYRGDPMNTGKALATDFREGCTTLPLILLRAKLSGQEREVLKTKFGNGVSDDELRMIREWMQVRGAFVDAEKIASEHIDAARSQLRLLPQTSAKAVLEQLCDFVIDRSH